MTPDSVAASSSTPQLLRLRTFHRRVDRHTVPSPEERTVASIESIWTNSTSFPSLPDIDRELSWPSPNRSQASNSSLDGLEQTRSNPPELSTPDETGGHHPLKSRLTPEQVPIYTRTGLSNSLIRPPASRQLRNPIWNLASYTDQLNYPLSDEWASSLGRRCADLTGDFYRIPSTPYYFLPPTTQGFLGPSTILGAGLGLFIENTFLAVNSGMVVGEYWGPSTANGGIPSIYQDPNPDLDDPPNARDDGAYLLRNDTYLVDAHEDCAVGYINDPFEEANCFFQIDPTNEHRILVVARVTFPINGVFEIFVNYG